MDTTKFNDIKSLLENADLSQDEITDLLVILCTRSEYEIPLCFTKAMDMFSSIRSGSREKGLMIKDPCSLYALEKYFVFFKDIESLSIDCFSFQSCSSSLPENVKNLTSLKRLHVEYSGKRGTKDIPDWIGNLINIEHLSFCSVDILVLPQSMKNLIHLRILDLHNSEIEIIPDWIIELPCIELLLLNSLKRPIISKYLKKNEKFKSILPENILPLF